MLYRRFLQDVQRHRRTLAGVSSLSLVAILVLNQNTRVLHFAVSVEASFRPRPEGWLEPHWMEPLHVPALLHVEQPSGSHFRTEACGAKTQVLQAPRWSELQ